MTLAEATKSAPFIEYAECVRDDNRPANHVGDWPEKGKIYPVRVMNGRTHGAPLVYVLGFEGEAPYYNAFGLDRFSLVGGVALN